MIRVLVPSMPTSTDVLPYLRRMDEARWYSNGGPLSQELALRIGDLVCAPCAVVSSGTAAIELALRAMRLPAGSEVLVPAVTFRGTGMAVVNAGLTPVLCDVDQRTWLLDHVDALFAIQARPTIRAVIPVAAFGAPVDVLRWETVRHEMNVRIVIDAAGSLLDQSVPAYGGMAVAFSLHATKSIGAGEGGVVASSSSELVRDVVNAANFGFNSSEAGTNAKLSEYHAAVALASIEQRAQREKAAQTLEAIYAQHLPTSCTLQAGRQSCRTLLPVLLPAGDGLIFRVQRAFELAGIEWKRWYWPFLHDLPQFAACARIGSMPISNLLSARLIGLPFHDFLQEHEVVHVCTTLERALND